MATIKYDGYSLVAAMQPGIEAFVVQKVKSVIEARVNELMEEVHTELMATLPTEIQVKLGQVLNGQGAYDVNVEVTIHGADA